MDNNKKENNIGQVVILIGMVICIFFTMVGSMFKMPTVIVSVFATIGFLIAVFGFVLTIILHLPKNNNATRTYDKTKMEHKDCDIVIGDGCLHEDVETGSKYKVCKNCGHKNTKDMKRCSVCGHRL
ncbi:MAG: hypothetical protein E7356_02470 [Clostridiales bacterium]|nr:hypothetical protein [Clostridiales bacterium]